MVASILRRGARRVLAAAMAAALLGPAAAFPEDTLPAGNAPIAANEAANAATRAPEFETGRVFRDCPHCPEMVVVPAGSFMMGSPASEEGRDSDEGPVHLVRIESPFAAGVYEVTGEEWDACASAGECLSYGGDRRRPVWVHWHSAQAYVAWLSRETGESYRLLSEAEWEYAARAGTTTRYWWGDDIGRNRAQCFGCGSLRDDEEGMAPVGSFEANAFGLHDVHGSAWEWVQDCWSSDYAGAPGDGSARGRDDCRYRIVRGGSSGSVHPWVLRAANRSSRIVRHSEYVAGFRVARTLTLAAAESEASGQRNDPWRDIRGWGRGSGMCETPDEEIDYYQSAWLATVRGDFLGDGRGIDLALWNGHRSCYIGRYGEGLAEPFDPGGYAGFDGVCRDRVSGRDHAIVRTFGGGSAGDHYILIWGLEAGGPSLLYLEYSAPSPVAADGACLWRERQRGIEINRAAMAALRIDRGAEAEDEPEGGRTGPSWRALAAETARENLQALRGGGMASFEGAFYADENARKSWFVVQVLAQTRTYGSVGDDGAVLLLERETGQWKSIYDVQPGYRSSYPVRGMVVADDRLYASLCVSRCEKGGWYRDFEIDLRTNRAARLDEGAEAPGPSEEENPELDDPVAAAFAE